MQDDRRLVRTIDKDGKDLDLYILKPNYRINRMCDIEYRKAFTGAIQLDAKPSVWMEKLFSDKGIWTIKEEQELRETNAKIAVQTVFMQRFYDQKKYEEASKAAAEIIVLRNYAHELGQLKSLPHIHSCEGIASEIRMEAYLAYATVYNDDHDKQFFNDYEDFKHRREEQAAIDVQAVYIGMIADENVNFINELPENRIFWWLNRTEIQPSPLLYNRLASTLTAYSLLKLRIQTN